jgi:nucleotide-binding universal stress UspA family protein
MYKKILIPLDGSKRAEKILPHVEELAARYQASVILLQVIDPAVDISRASLLVPLSDHLAPRRDSAESYLNGVKARLEKKKIGVRTMVETGIPLEMICQTAEAEKVDLIALASHGRTGAARLFYGSVSGGILHRVDRPLLLIRSQKAV